MHRTTCIDMIFISGLHRSGTTLLHDIIAQNDQVSAFQNTGVPQNEGQHLQSVFLPAKAYGGPGRFAFSPEAHLTEKSNLVTEINRDTLLTQWNHYWNADKRFFLEKSPPNLIRTRFLQAMFPGSYFITIIRNPIVVAFATQKWSKTSIENLVEHWFLAHQIYLEDRKYLQHEHLISYEDLITDTDNILQNISNFLHLDISTTNNVEDKNKQYLKRWSYFKFLHRREYRTIINKWGEQLNDWGYGL